MERALHEIDASLWKQAAWSAHDWRATLQLYSAGLGSGAYMLTCILCHHQPQQLLKPPEMEGLDAAPNTFTQHTRLGP